MSVFLFVITLIFLPFNDFEQDPPCGKSEVLKSYDAYGSFKNAYEAYENNQFEKAFELIKVLRKQAENDEDELLKHYVLFLEAELYKENNSHQKAIETFELLLNDQTVNNDLKFFANIGIGDIYISGLGQFHKVPSYYEKAEELIENNSCIARKSLIYSALGNIGLLTRKYKESEAYYKKGLNIFIENADYNEASVNYNNLGNLYFEQYKDNLAMEYFHKALNILTSKDSTNIKTRQRINANLSAVYEAANDHEKALKYLIRANTLRDSIWNADRVWEIAELEKKFAVEQKQKEVEILEIENKVKDQQRKIYLYATLLLLLLLLTAFYFYREKVKTNKIISNQNLELDKLNATKDKLFSIVSHDLRSSVNALKTSNKDLVNSLKTKDIGKLDTLLNTNSSIVNGAYNLLDNLLNWALLQTKQSYFSQEEHRLFFLVEHVAFNYTALLNEKGISLKNIVTKSEKVYVDQESLKIVLRNLIDNAIKFSNENGKIQIYSQPNGNYVDLIIEDNGIGMSNSTQKELLKDTNLLSKRENKEIIGTGLGMQLCRSMIAKNKGMFTIQSELGAGTKMIVSLPKFPQNA